MKIRFNVAFLVVALGATVGQGTVWNDGWALVEVVPASQHHYISTSGHHYVPVSHHKYVPATAYGKCHGNKEGEQRCMQDLGCFNLTSDFYHPVYRPCNLLPEDRVAIGTRFVLYTPNDRAEGRVLTSEGVAGANIASSLRTKIIVHSIGEHHLHTPWIRKLKDEFLQNGDYNVIVVDWHDGGRHSYSQSVANSRVVGAEVARLVTSLQGNANIDLQNIHIIGHGVGAHVAGYAGERINKVGRISALDPAETYFENMPAIVRLDPTDADFVDVIHTDIAGYEGGLGMKEVIGHVDFFPNGGRHQPGCDHLHHGHVHVVKGYNGAALCNHQRAVHLFIDSIKQDETCAPVAHACSDWETFIEGRCADCGAEGRDCAILGIRAEEYRPLKSDDNKKMFFLKTKGHSPYCLQHFQLRLEISRPKNGHSLPGKMHILVKGDDKEVNFHSVHSFHHVKEGEVYRALVVSPKPLGAVQNITVWWDSHAHGYYLYHSHGYHKGYSSPSPDVLLEKLTISPMNAITTSENERRRNELEFCRAGEPTSGPHGSPFWYQLQRC